MEWSLVRCLWVSFVLLLGIQIQRCLGCLEEERNALLEIKAFVDYWPKDAKEYGSWVDDGKGSTDCCTWKRVMCDATIGRVIQLSLNHTSIYETGNGHPYLNVTLFSAFQELQHLNLSSNWFDGWIENEGFERLVGLRKLEVLDLSYNNFNDSIIPSLAALTSLRTLSLAGNYYLVGSSHWEELSNLHNLEVLDLTGNHFNNNILPSWGVLTSLRTLSLAGNYYLNGFSFWEELGDLHNLQSLDLRDNNIEATLQTIQGFKSLVGLKELEVLDLSFNSFNCNILPSLGALTTLRSLSIGFNNLNGSSHWEELSNLHNLQSLNLTFNSIEASLQTIQGFERLMFGLTKLEVLDLSYNRFNNNILPTVGTFKSLRQLFLSDNNLEGSSHFEGLCQLKHLQALGLARNKFEGILPPCLKNLTALRQLDLSHNRFKGNIDSSLISSLTSLVAISLRDNDFDGLFSFISFANNSNLNLIDLDGAGNKLKVETDDEYSSWVPPFQLKVLFLSNNNLNAIPRFLTTQHNLTEVDLSSNNLTGMIPTWLLENNNMLSFLKLRNNSLGGHFVLPSHVHEAIQVIDISNNGFGGLLHANIGKMLPNIEYLDLSKNNFEGFIPASIGDMKMLSVLDLSNNNFSGEIPTQMAIGCNNLLVLRASNNRLHGQMLPSSFKWSALELLHLDNNLFSGNILPGLSKFSRLAVLKIGNNVITGRIPNWIGNLTNLQILDMGGNSLQGNIPIEFCKLEGLSFLDLSQNLLVGSIPSILNLTELQFLHLQGNGFTRTPPTTRFNSSSLVTLDIGDNDLYGVIPELIGALPNLRVLLLKQNHFSGPIPNYFCQLALINIMDLSQNTLSGSIPQCLNNISFGRIRGIGGAFSTISFFYWFAGPIYYELYFSPDDSGASELHGLDNVEFFMKSRSNLYKGDILNFVSGLDLSYNNFQNDIPSEIGDLNGILALNLSHNQLIGPIPRILSNLTQIESLDLSYNKLSGEIPSELSTLYSLEVFTVAHNNLSGKTPEMKEQFSTFTSTSYEGNPFLCGPPLPRDCSSNSESTNTTETPSIGVKDDDDIDMITFFASFGASYVMVLLGFAAVLYINPNWRRMWFSFIEHCIYSCHEFVSDAWYNLVIRACT